MYYFKSLCEIIEEIKINETLHFDFLKKLIKRYVLNDETSISMRPALWVHRTFQIPMWFLDPQYDLQVLLYAFVSVSPDATEVVWVKWHLTRVFFIYVWQLKQYHNDIFCKVNMGIVGYLILIILAWNQHLKHMDMMISLSCTGWIH